MTPRDVVALVALVVLVLWLIAGVVVVCFMASAKEVPTDRPWTMADEVREDESNNRALREWQQSVELLYHPPRVENDGALLRSLRVWPACSCPERDQCKAGNRCNPISEVAAHRMMAAIFPESPKWNAFGVPCEKTGRGQS